MSKNIGKATLFLLACSAFAGPSHTVAQYSFEYDCSMTIQVGNSVRTVAQQSSNFNLTKDHQGMICEFVTQAGGACYNLTNCQ